MLLSSRRLTILVLILVASAGAVDPNGDEKETCPGGADGVKAGNVTSNAIEAKGIDNMERCLSSEFHSDLITDIEWRCETRHCCQEPCNCSKPENLHESPCTPGTEVSQLRCLVQNRRPQPRFHKWICCEGYVEHPDTHQCLITCDINNGNCHQVCKRSLDPPYHGVCSCNPGFKEHGADPKMCTDHDECLTENGGCSDICNNTIGSYTCACTEGRVFVEGSKLKCQDVVPPVAQPAAQESNSSNTGFIIGGIVGAIALLALLILLLIFLCKRKKKVDEEPPQSTAFANRTYGDLEGQGARASVAEYGDTEAEVIKKKLPLEGAVGVINPGYVGEKKALEAGYAIATPNVYEEIPDIKHRKGKHLNQPMTDSNDGYESPLGIQAGKVPLPGLIDEMNVDNPTYNGARPKQQGVLKPPEYSEIPTPAEVEADPRPPVYSNMGREPVRFKDFQEVKYANVDDEDLPNHHVDIKDIDVADKDLN